MKREWIQDLELWQLLGNTEKLVFATETGRTTRVSFKPEEDILVYGLEAGAQNQNPVLLTRATSGERTEIKVSHLTDLTITTGIPDLLTGGQIFYRVHTGQHTVGADTFAGESFVTPMVRMDDLSRRFAEMEMQTQMNSERRIAQMQQDFARRVEAIENANESEPKATGSEQKAIAGGKAKVGTDPMETDPAVDGKPAAKGSEGDSSSKAEPKGKPPEAGS